MTARTGLQRAVILLIALAIPMGVAACTPETKTADTRSLSEQFASAHPDAPKAKASLGQQEHPPPIFVPQSTPTAIDYKPVTFKPMPATGPLNLLDLASLPGTALYTLNNDSRAQVSPSVEVPVSDVFVAYRCRGKGKLSIDSHQGFSVESQCEKPGSTQGGGVGPFKARNGKVDVTVTVTEGAYWTFVIYAQN